MSENSEPSKGSKLDEAVQSGDTLETPTADSTGEDDSKFKGFLRETFKLKENGTNIKTEILAGFTSFLTMAYIIVVNPAILSDPFGANQQYSAILFSTVLVSCIMSIVMGLLSNNPYAVAPGMGLNAYVGYVLLGSGEITWEAAMGAIIIIGAALTIMSLTPVSSGVLKAIPKSLRYGLAAGIGLFLVLIGCENAGVVVHRPNSTLIEFGGFNLTFVLFLFGLILTTILMMKDVKAAFVIGIVMTSLLAVMFSFTGWGEALDSAFAPITIGGIIDIPDTSTFLRFDLAGALEPAMIIPLFTLGFTDLFDSISTFLGVSEVGGLLNEDGNPKNFKRTLIADSMTTMMSGFFGTSDATTYIESAAGVKQGGRTGLTAVVTGLFFLPFMFFSPLLSIIPTYATAPILVLLGVLMFKPLVRIDWDDFEEAVPAFLAAILIPFTYSITYGIVFGVLSYVIIKIFAGKIREINVWLWITFTFALFALIAPIWL